MSLAGYLLRRCLAGVAVLLAVSLLGSLLLESAPGSLDGAWGADPRLTGEARENARRAAGVEEPWSQRYLAWMSSLTRADLGTSRVTGQPVAAMIAERLPATLELMTASLFMALLAAFTLGGIGALWWNRLPDRLLSGMTLGTMALPTFWVGLLAIGLLAVGLGWFPAGGRSSPAGSAGVGDHLWHLALPATVLALGAAARWSRYVRVSLREAVIRESWRVAEARGLGKGMLLWRHGIVPSLGPIITVVALEAPGLFAGALITETIFGWPGVGRLFQEGLQRRDDPRLMGILLLTSLLIVSFNLLADLLQARLDPRVEIHGTS